MWNRPSKYENNLPISLQSKIVLFAIRQIPPLKPFVSPVNSSQESAFSQQ